MQACEPRQVRKKAAVSGYLYVPRGCSGTVVQYIKYCFSTYSLLTVFFYPI